MKILVCSDSHGNGLALEALKMLHPDCNLYLLAGDSESSSYDIFPFQSVKGNCDWFDGLQERMLISTPYGNLLMQHYPQLPQKIISDYNIKVFIHGHTHKRREEHIGDLLIINPGSISFTRDNHDGSYVILELDENNIAVHFKQI